MFLKIQGQLLEVLGPDARGNMEEIFGIKILPIYQFLDGEIPVSLAIVKDENKVQKIINHPKISILNTVNDFNAMIDELYVEKYVLKDAVELQIDLQLSGNHTIPNYDATKPLNSQHNLKALYEAGMGGIVKSVKPPYLNE